MSPRTLPEPVSVVVVARNRQGLIGRCLHAVRAAGASEVVVVDGMSVDQTAMIAQRAGARVVSDRGAGLAAARQIGAAEAKYSWVGFVDSDAVLQPNTLQNLVSEAIENGYDAIQAALLPLPGPASYWQRGEAWRRRMQEVPGLASAIGCQATLVRRSVVLEVKFDDVFSGAGEDGDFFRRVTYAGFKVAISRRAFAYHEDRRQFMDFARQRYWHGRGLARTAFRYRGQYGAALKAGTVRLGQSAGNRSVHQSGQYIPFLTVSSVVLAMGMAFETIRLVGDVEMRRRLKEGAV